MRMDVERKPPHRSLSDFSNSFSQLRFSWLAGRLVEDHDRTVHNSGLVAGLDMMFIFDEAGTPREQVKEKLPNHLRDIRQRLGEHLEPLIQS